MAVESRAPEPPDSLARRLWTGALTDPDAPWQALKDRIDRGCTLDAARAMLRMVQAAGLPAQAAMQAARARWPDDLALALIAAEGAADSPAAARDTALADLDALVAGSGTGTAARARLLWRLGRWQAARDSLRGGADTMAPPMLVARVDLALRAGDWPAAEADIAALAGRIGAGHHLALSLRLTWARDGAAALVCRLGPALAGQPGHLPAAPGLWRVITDLLQRSPDPPRAARALARLRAIAGPDHPAVRRAALVQALDSGTAAQARALLEGLPDADAPWRWSPQRHVLALRAGLAQAREEARPRPLLAALAEQAAAACRLHARHPGLTAMGWTCRLASGDWTGLEAALAAHLQLPPFPGADLTPAAALRLGQIGRPDAGLAVLGTWAPAPDTPATLAARHALARLQLARACGQAPRADTAPGASAGSLNAGMAADLAAERALALIEAGRPGPALALLRDPLRRFPRRPALWLARMRAHFHDGDFRQAARALERFNRLTTAVRPGHPAGEDLRDMVVRDALQAARALPPGSQTDSPAALLARLGKGAVAGSTALGAWLLARAAGDASTGEDPLRTLLPARPRQAMARAIPHRLLHYWEGPPCEPVDRILTAWSDLHPGLARTVHSGDTAQAWLARHDPQMARLFTALAGQPAARADLLRLAVLAREGGIWADVDEAPRAPVLDWLTGAAGVFVLEPGFGTVANNFIAAVPGLPAITTARALAMQAVQRRLDTGEPVYPWRDSGPGVMTRALMLCLAAQGPPEADDTLRLLPPARYLARVATNLPLPHKRGALHWR